MTDGKWENIRHAVATATNTMALLGVKGMKGRQQQKIQERELRFPKPFYPGEAERLLPRLLLHLIMML